MVLFLSKLNSCEHHTEKKNQRLTVQEKGLFLSRAHAHGGRNRFDAQEIAEKCVRDRETKNLFRGPTPIGVRSNFMRESQMEKSLSGRQNMIAMPNEVFLLSS